MFLSVEAIAVCEALEWDGYYSLHRIRFAWNRPPDRCFLWVSINNPAEREVAVSVQVFRRGELVQESGDELLLGNTRRLETDVELHTADFERKTYTVQVSLNGVAAERIIVDFGAGEEP